MYAIIRDGGRQFKVESGQELEIDFRDASKGDEITFDDVLAVSSEEGIQIGTPKVESASVKAEVLGVTQGPKLIIQKFRRRKNSRSKTGHRQMYIKVKINEIQA